MTFILNNYQWLIPLVIGGIVVPFIIFWLTKRNQNRQKDKNLISDNLKITNNKIIKENSKKNLIIDGQFFHSIEWYFDQNGIENFKELKTDIDGDGFDEIITVGINTPNGTRLNITIGKESYNLAYDIKGLDEYGELPAGGCQLVIVDVTNDGLPEILLGFHSNTNESHLNIWKFDKNIYLNTPRRIYKNPFIFIGDIIGQGFENYRILPEGKIEVPFGFQGLYDTYYWNGKKFIQN